MYRYKLYELDGTETGEAHYAVGDCGHFAASCSSAHVR